MSRERASATGRAHLAALAGPLARLEDDCERLGRWGRHLGDVLLAGGRLLAAGNGGSAALAEHLTAELVGRYRTERPPLSALCLHADASALTAIANDYGQEEAYARQVRAHARPGDVLLAFSTSGRSANVLAAADAARRASVAVWSMTGPAPNPLFALSDDALSVDARAVATVQEIHQVAVHILCEAVDAVLLDRIDRPAYSLVAR
jgi:D-sedoheptulose 7-phosphate isomerase